MPTVKKVAATSDAARAEANARSTRKTKAAKSGATARLMASAERYLEKNEPGRGNKKTIKVNSNPNKTPAKGKRNPTQQDIYEKELRDVRQDKLGFKESSSKKRIKVNSNPVKAGKTKVSPMAKVRKPGNFRGRGGAIGGGFLDQLK